MRRLRPMSRAGARSMPAATSSSPTALQASSATSGCSSPDRARRRAGPRDGLAHAGSAGGQRAGRTGDGCSRARSSAGGVCGPARGAAGPSARRAAFRARLVARGHGLSLGQQPLRLSGLHHRLHKVGAMAALNIRVKRRGRAGFGAEPCGGRSVAGGPR